MHHDLSDLGSLILIEVIPKECTVIKISSCVRSHVIEQVEQVAILAWP